MHCAVCLTEMIVDTTPYEDLDEDMPEMVCTGCGSAIISVPLTGRVWWRPRDAKIAPQQRRAA